MLLFSLEDLRRLRYPLLCDFLLYLLNALDLGAIAFTFGTGSGDLLGQLSAQIISLQDRLSFAVLKRLDSAQGLILVDHQAVRVFCCQEHVMLIKLSHLRLFDAVLICNQLDQLLGLLSRTLLLQIIALQELLEFLSPLG